MLLSLEMAMFAGAQRDGGLGVCSAARRAREAVAALDAVVEPFVQHDVAQPAIAELARELRAQCFEHRVTMPARAGLYFGEPRIVINANLQIRIRERCAGVVEHIRQPKGSRVTRTLIDSQMQRAVAGD